MFLRNLASGTVEEERLANRLAFQSRRLERVLARRRMSVQVVGGTVERDSTSFQIRDHLMLGLGRLREFAQDLPHLLGVGTVSVSQDHGYLRLALSDRDQQGVALLDLMPLVPDTPPACAILGIDVDGRVVLLDASGHELPNVLLSACGGSGKASLLRTIAISLALLNRQSYVQMVVISSRAPAAESSYPLLEPLSYLPHMLSPVAHSLADTIELTAFLVSEMKHRRYHRVTVPALVVMVDGIVELLMQGGELMSEQFTQLIQHGAEAGIFLILSTERPESTLLEEHLKSSVAVRIVGRLDSPRAANVAAGGSSLTPLAITEPGEFAAIVDGDAVVNFTAASIADHDLHFCLDRLQRAAPLTLLARPLEEGIGPLTVGTDPFGSTGAAKERLTFRFDGEHAALDLDSGGPRTNVTADDAWPDDASSAEELV